MTTELKIPSVGESITEVQIARWLKAVGDTVRRDEPLAELETDKASLDLPAAVSGTLAKVLKNAGETAAVGEVVALVEEGGTAMPQEPAQAQPPSTEVEEEPAPATGQDVEATPREPAAAPPEPPPPPQPPTAEQREKPAATAQPPAPQPPAGPPVAGGDREQEVVPMSPMRRRIAQRLVEAHQTAALLSTFNEVDMSAIVALRAKYRELFEKQHGVRLGLMSFFVKAAIEALKLIPQVNAEIRGQQIIYRNYYDIGIAVNTPKGLVVPVLRHAQRMSFAEIERAIDDFARRAGDNKLELAELEGGTFTISNGGVFGSLLSTPIVNPPQSGILGMHAIQDRPVARDKQVVIRPMMYLALTYDHRIVDGKGAVLFLNRIRDVLEEPSRALLEI